MNDAPSSDPLVALAQWHRDAMSAGVREPDAMTLATATAEGRPSARIVLYKGLMDGRVQFVSNYASRKGREMDENPRVALVFFWPELARQVRIEGRAERSSAAVSEAYFAGRPRESQLGAWASLQSQPLASRVELERRLIEVTERFAGQTVTRPPAWGMYSVLPERVELWLGGAHRLHDRFVYTRQDNSWHIERLAP